MANMDYCRFQNTVEDLRDCLENLKEDDISAREAKFRIKLLKLCQEMLSRMSVEEAEEEHKYVVANLIEEQRRDAS